MANITADNFDYWKRVQRDDTGYVITACLAVLIYLLGIAIVTFFCIRSIVFNLFWLGGGIS